MKVFCVWEERALLLMTAMEHLQMERYLELVLLLLAGQS